MGFTGPNPCGLNDVVAKLEMIGRKHDDGRAVLEPAELIALADAYIAWKHSGSRRSGIEQNIQKMQPDTGNQDSCDRNQGQGFAASQPDTLPNIERRMPILL